MSVAELNSLLDSVAARLAKAAGEMPEGQLLDPLRRILAERPEKLIGVAGGIPAHRATLNQVFRLAKSGSSVSSALARVADHLHWKVDDGGFYAKGADVGAGYREGNLHALLVGPSRAPVYSSDQLLGFFLLTPRTLYRDHAHRAPEFYLPLTGPSGWRFDKGEWRDIAAGQPVFNPPDRVHAMRVYDTPFLALFGWTCDIEQPCRVVPAPDWTQIEDELVSAQEKTPPEGAAF